MLLPRTWMIRFHDKTIYKVHDMVRLTVIVAITFLSNLAFLHHDQPAAHQWDVPVPYLPERLQLARTGSCPNCELPDTDLSYKALAYAELNGANLRRVNFMRTALRYAKLIGADLRFANFTWTDLYQADFTNANLSGALLAQSRNLSEAIFCRTVMPDGAVSDLHC